MGYTTDFHGELDIAPVLTDEHRQYLQAFSRSRRMKRRSTICQKIIDAAADGQDMGQFQVSGGRWDAIPDTEKGENCLLQVAAGLPTGDEGEYFLGLGDGIIDSRDLSVIDYNTPPSTQPGLWCGWTVTDKGDALGWDGAEKFYGYVEWLRYIVEHFMNRWGYTLNGMIDWQGEDGDDRGTIYVKDNRVEAIDAEIHVGRPSWES